MDEVPPFLRRLIQRQRLTCSDLSAQSRKQLCPLLVGGVLIAKPSGRGEVLEVHKPEIFLAWVRQTYPSFEGHWHGPKEFGRAQSIARRRSSKAAGSGIGAGVLHIRALADGGGSVTCNGVDFPVRELTAKHGLAACLITPQTRFEFTGQVVIIENLECFLHAELIIPDASVFLNSAGRISDQLVAALSRSSFSPSPITHFPDYDPVGLSDYLRIRAMLGPHVRLFTPPDIERRFAALADRRLIADKPRNRALLEKLISETWPCPESQMVFRLIKESGAGLEQESLLLDCSD